MQESIINLILQAHNNYKDSSRYSTTLACCTYMNRAISDCYYWKKMCIPKVKDTKKLYFIFYLSILKMAVTCPHY